jgi:hypothetical protein
LTAGGTSFATAGLPAAAAGAAVDAELDDGAALELELDDELLLLLLPHAATAIAAGSANDASSAFLQVPMRLLKVDYPTHQADQHRQERQSLIGGLTACKSSPAGGVVSWIAFVWCTCG